MFFPKLIVTDLDGTALKNDKTISDRTIQAFSVKICQIVRISLHLHFSTSR